MGDPGSCMHGLGVLSAADLFACGFLVNHILS